MDAMDTPFSDKDLLFLAKTAMPGRDDYERVVGLIRSDPDFVDALLSDERVARRLLGDDAGAVRVSPRLYFAALLLKARKDLEAEDYALERRQHQNVAIFDAKQAAKLLSDRTVRAYLANMLASFTRVQGYTRRTQVRKGVWHRQRFSDLDIDSLIRYGNAVGKERRFAIYKRIADVCLFLAGVFPEYLEAQTRYPFSHFKRSLEDYEREGRTFYGLAAEHRGTQDPDLSAALAALAEHFTLAEKPLTFVSDHYLKLRKHTLFDL
ncbi:MAG TPA: hypothetical protein PLJ35_02245 [Anaerolineae bacterium]|nr:hypothetical protein [Anaerolineae bacterium]HOQ97625.1 hypothetical protein [Anaerolineae bacterium]HPL26541.1 hypothetical protein [Anaerolineae bacterium]HPL26568.1 hypothetical protein [Anaerolineae bacterium]